MREAAAVERVEAERRQIPARTSGTAAPERGSRAPLARAHVERGAVL